MSQATELIEALRAQEATEAFASVENFRQAAQALGVDADVIEAALALVNDFPLDDEALDAVSGGMIVKLPPSHSKIIY